MATERAMRLMKRMMDPGFKAAETIESRAETALRNLEHQASNVTGNMPFVLIPLQGEQLNSEEEAVVAHMCDILGLNIRSRAYIARPHFAGPEDRTIALLINPADLLRFRTEAM